MGELVGGDAGARVADDEAHLAIHRLGAEPDPSAGGSELDGVADEVREHLKGARGVGDDARKVIVDDAHQLE
jgi:hypothetical protein